MKNFSVDTNKCNGCGVCKAECIVHDISIKNKQAHYNNNGNCIECFHCFKICPNKAIDYRGKVVATIFDSTDNVSPIVSRRSCRSYKKTSMDKEILTNLINVANSAPRFDIKYEERLFFVIDDKEKLNDVRNVILGQINKARKIFSILVKNPFLAKAKKDELNSIISLFKTIIEKSKKSDALFHGATALVMVAGEKATSTSIDNSFYALSQFLIAAEEEGIGTCISGFVSFFSKAVQKNLGIDKKLSIHCAAGAGYPAKHFTRHLVRNETSINWN